MRQRHLRRALILAALMAGPGLAGTGEAQKADPALDDELLEFLGSVDPASDSAQPDDGSWIDYLSQTDIGKVVKPAQPPQGKQAKPPASAAQPSTSGVDTE